MTDAETKEVYVFKLVLPSGEEMPTAMEYSGEGTIFYSSGDKYSGSLVMGVS